MLFNSTEFLVFYVAVMLVDRVLAIAGTWSLRKLFLVLASYVFYMSWNAPFVLLLVLSTAVDFIAARRIHRSTELWRRRAWLIVSLAANLGILGYFKYGKFLFENAAWAVGSSMSPPSFLDVVLPLGISFYTFQTMSYTIDVYRRMAEPTSNLLDFALYVSFFPQLVAGPIVRAADFLPQTKHATEVDDAAGQRGLMLIFVGLFKKVVLADALGEYVDVVFADVGSYAGLNLLVAIYAYAFQIYFDFSGYSDMAIGLAALLGFRLPINFRLPYLAENPSEFWQRWHISLSTWLRDYLYIPLGGNRSGEARTYRNLMLTMLLGGLWHGAAWNFVIWGFYHGVLLAIHRRFFRGPHPRTAPVGVFLRRFAMFQLTCVGWVFFRVQSGADIGTFFANLPSAELVTSPLFHRAVVWTTLAYAFHHLLGAASPARFFLRTPPLLQASVYATIAVLVFLFSPVTGRFIYFQF